MASYRHVRVCRLEVSAFRNLRHVDFSPGPGLNIVSGDNGQGKTNVLEALYVVATTKSFRTQSARDLVLLGESRARVRAEVCCAEDETSTQAVTLSGGRRHLALDDKACRSSRDFATRLPTVVFAPESIELTQGSGAERRKLLDRISFFQGSLPNLDLASYTRAIRARQRVLLTHGASRDRELSVWEELVVTHGLSLTLQRERAFVRLKQSLRSSFARIAHPDAVLEARYVRTAPETAEEYRKVLFDERARDARRRSAGIGPHRDDVELTLGGKPVRATASQGQHRALVLAVKLSEIELIGQATELRPVLLLDDVSSELDRDRADALMRALGEHHGQVFLTTARRDLFDKSALPSQSVLRDYRMAQGTLSEGL